MAGYKILGLADEVQNKNSAQYKIVGPADTQSTNASMPQKKQGISSIPGDIADAGANLFMALGNKAMQLPDEVTQSAQQFASHPLAAPVRASRGVLAGLLEGGKQLYNLPLELNTYLASKGVPIFKQTAPLAEKLKIGDTGLQKLVMGQPQAGDALWQDVGAILPAIAAPELAPSITRGKSFAITPKGITKALSKDKQAAISKAEGEYKELFDQASSKGITHAIPTPTVENSKNIIMRNSSPKYNQAYQTYLNNPTIENAHWAQSELGALARHLEKIEERQGLTPTQNKTLKAARDSRDDIKSSMFSNNALGADESLGNTYNELGKKYLQDVIPYKRLEALSKVESGKLRPKKAISKLMNDEEFRLKLAKNYPGLFLHTPTAGRIGWGAAGLLGYEELKKLLQ